VIQTGCAIKITTVVSWKKRMQKIQQIESQNTFSECEAHAYTAVIIKKDPAPTMQ
jgi:hypothetical protein